MLPIRSIPTLFVSLLALAFLIWITSFQSGAGGLLGDQGAPHHTHAHPSANAPRL